MKIKTIIIAMLLAVFAMPSSAEDDHALVAATIQKYFDGAGRGEAELVSQAFAPTLEVQGIKDGKIQRLSVPQYLDIVKQGRTKGRISRLINIDISNTAAIAKAEIKMGDRTVIDYFLLLKTDEGWKVSNKIYSTLPNK